MWRTGGPPDRGLIININYYQYIKYYQYINNIIYYNYYQYHSSYIVHQATVQGETEYVS